MDATLFTSTGTTQTITNNDNGTTGFKPDLLWVKSRSVADDNILNDSVRGVANYLVSNTTAAEVNKPTYLTSFNSDGFSIGTGNFTNGVTLVAWQWQAGQGTNTTNTAGSLTSTVSVNQTAGFSIVTFTKTATTSQTIGHGLGIAPSFYVVKTRQSSGYTSWAVYHSSIGAGNYLELNSTAASASSSTIWNNTSPTSSVFSMGTAWTATQNMVAYCWAPVAGFSQFGSYTGNNSADGPFIYTGFRPKFILFKLSSGGLSDWTIIDTSRDTYNTCVDRLNPNTSAAESTGYNVCDILSNGFKLRSAIGDWNVSATYIYAAFAENPFKYANAR